MKELKEFILEWSNVSKIPVPNDDKKTMKTYLRNPVNAIYLLLSQGDPSEKIVLKSGGACGATKFVQYYYYRTKGDDQLYVKLNFSDKEDNSNSVQNVPITRHDILKACEKIFKDGKLVVWESDGSRSKSSSQPYLPSICCTKSYNDKPKYEKAVLYNIHCVKELLS